MVISVLAELLLYGREFCINREQAPSQDINLLVAKPATNCIVEGEGGRGKERERETERRRERERGRWRGGGRGGEGEEAGEGRGGEREGEGRGRGGEGEGEGIAFILSLLVLAHNNVSRTVVHVTYYTAKAYSHASR